MRRGGRAGRGAAGEALVDAAGGAVGGGVRGGVDFRDAHGNPFLGFSSPLPASGRGAGGEGFSSPRTCTQGRGGQETASSQRYFFISSSAASRSAGCSDADSSPF